MSDPAPTQVALRHRIGPLALDAAFTLTHPWTFLFAPSGAGKSTILRIIAGLIRPDHARIVAADRTVLIDTATRIFLPAHKRSVRFVGQQAALFPHQSVLRNILFGSPTKHPEEVMELCRIQHLAAKMPAELSGGERQRVALARALAATPSRLLLLDEPFSGLDTALRDQLVTDLKPWLSTRNIPVLQVTHDIAEVFALQAEVLRLANGSIVAQGPPETILRPEKNRLLQHLTPPPQATPQAPAPASLLTAATPPPESPPAAAPHPHNPPHPD